MKYVDPPMKYVAPPISPVVPCPLTQGLCAIRCEVVFSEVADGLLSLTLE